MAHAERKIEVCLSPELLHLFDVSTAAVVVVDILRATSCMVTALAHGMTHIVPVASLDVCKTYKEAGYITAAERDGKKAEGFDLGNSPFSYMDPQLAGKRLAMTTTNGTQAIVKAQKAKNIFIGAFLNIHTLAHKLSLLPDNVLVICAGWKGSVNAEDTYFAGALCHVLQGQHQLYGDAALLALSLYRQYEADPMALIKQSSHYARLSNLGISDDITFCLKHEVYSILPYFENGVIRL